MIERYIKRSRGRVTEGASCCTVCGKWISWPFDHEPQRGRCTCAELEQAVATIQEFVARGAAAQGAVDALTLKPALRMCNVCGHQAAKGAGKEGNLCPLLACPGDLRG